MVDDQIDRYQRVDFHGVAPEIFYDIPHGDKIHHCGNTGKILHQNPCRMKRYFHRFVISFFPPGNLEHILFSDNTAIQFP